MMQYFSMFDKVSQGHSNLIPAVNPKSLYRWLQDTISPEHAWRKHPEDFSLLHVLDLSDDNEILPTTPKRPVTLLNTLTMVFDSQNTEVSNG